MGEHPWVPRSLSQGHHFSVGTRPSQDAFLHGGVLPGLLENRTSVQAGFPLLHPSNSRVPRPPAGPQAKGTCPPAHGTGGAPYLVSCWKVLEDQARRVQHAREHRSRPLLPLWKLHGMDRQVPGVLWKPPHGRGLTSHPATSLTSSKGVWEGHSAPLGARPGSQGRSGRAWPSCCPLPEASGLSCRQDRSIRDAGRAAGRCWPASQMALGRSPPGCRPGVIPDETVALSASSRGYFKHDHFLISSADGLPIIAFQRKDSEWQQTLWKRILGLD